MKVHVNTDEAGDVFETEEIIVETTKFKIVITERSDKTERIKVYDSGYPRNDNSINWEERYHQDRWYPWKGGIVVATLDDGSC